MCENLNVCRSAPTPILAFPTRAHRFPGCPPPVVTSLLGPRASKPPPPLSPPPPSHLRAKIPKGNLLPPGWVARKDPSLPRTKRVAPSPLSGPFVKVVDTLGWVNPRTAHCAMAVAFGHWAYHFTDGRLVVCNIKGPRPPPPTEGEGGRDVDHICQHFHKTFIRIAILMGMSISTLRFPTPPPKGRIVAAQSADARHCGDADYSCQYNNNNVFIAPQLTRRSISPTRFPKTVIPFKFCVR